jgi:hypothetical protein
MEDEHQPVEESEFVYRRIPEKYYDPDVPVPIPALAFRPNQRDTTGISVFRARFLTPAQTLAGVEASKRNSYYVARLAVSDLKRLGLTVLPEPDPHEPAGHSVIPELSWKAYQADKQRLRDVQLELAILASRGIVHTPN